MARKYIIGLLMAAPIVGCGENESKENIQGDVQEEAPPAVADTICQDLLATEHSDLYLSLESNCSALGKEEDDLYRPRNILLERYREEFHENNIVETLGLNFELPSKEGRIKFSTDNIQYTEKMEGSETNDVDVSAGATYTRQVVDNRDNEVGELPPITITASRMTARGSCNQYGILADMALNAAKDPENFGFGTMYIGNGYAIFSSEKKVWISGDSLIEVNEAQEPFRFSFSDPLLELMTSDFPSNFRCDYEGGFNLMEGGCRGDEPSPGLEKVRKSVAQGFNSLRWELYKNNCIEQ